MTAGNDGTSAQLGRLLNFVADMATAIRLNSAYRGVQTGPDEQASLDVMWLSDSLHNFNQLGRALEGGDVALVIGACEALKSYYELFIRGDRFNQALKGDPKRLLQKYPALFRPQEAVAAFDGIRSFYLARTLNEKHGSRVKHYHFHDPRSDATYLRETLAEMVELAESMGSTRFQAVTDDERYVQVKKVDGRWLSEDGLPLDTGSAGQGA